MIMRSYLFFLLIIFFALNIIHSLLIPITKQVVLKSLTLEPSVLARSSRVDIYKSVLFNNQRIQQSTASPRFVSMSLRNDAVTRIGSSAKIVVSGNIILYNIDLTDEY
jgi:hypothetical protein